MNSVFYYTHFKKWMDQNKLILARYMEEVNKIANLENHITKKPKIKTKTKKVKSKKKDKPKKKGKDKEKKREKK
jgi:hypothetical protein